MRWEILLQRQTKNRLNSEITQRKLRTLAGLAEQNPTLGFEGSVSKMREPQRGVDAESSEEVYIYKSRIVVTNAQASDPATADASFRRHVLESIQKQAAVDGWTIRADGIVATHQISGVTGSEVDIPLTALMDEGIARPAFNLPELHDDANRRFFAGVYEREPHIRMIHDAMRAYVRSGGEQRSHVLLEGKPACAKTILFERFKKFYEQDAPDGIERVAFIDGPTMSKAGLENWLLELAVANKLPEVICIEEIEKQHMDNLLTLLSVMGSGYIMKTNARIGRMKQLAKCVIWATCNDKQLLKDFRDGALWSRFTHKLHCRRPSRELMTRIIRDKVANTNGDPRWAEAAIEFAYDGMTAAVGQPMLDPRAILGLLDGAERLLDGSYQADYLATFSIGCVEEEGINRLMAS
ncbi:MAG: hypothetical protein JWP89_860 [Schlesneria sp.]|nr:hypothetical protein [Schlesneria sp.]